MHQVSRPPSSALAKLSPAYFGMVMATGIVSIGAWRLGLPRLAWGLFGLNLAAYGLLWLLFVARLIRYPRLFARDLVDHLQGPGFFTMVAASSILGSQFLLQADNVGAGLVLWCVAIVLWLLLTYSIFAAFTIKENKPTLDRGISGGWLLAVVATQSIAVLSALLASHVAQPSKLEMNFFALSMWLWGGMLYIWMMSLIFYRYTFFPFRPDDLSPPYWINMGAMAISTLGHPDEHPAARHGPHREAVMAVGEAHQFDDGRPEQRGGGGRIQDGQRVAGLAIHGGDGAPGVVQAHGLDDAAGGEPQRRRTIVRRRRRRCSRRPPPSGCPRRCRGSGCSGAPAGRGRASPGGRG